MEIKIKRDVLLDGIQKTLGIVEKRSTLPILNNVLLKAAGNRITIAATNREISLISSYEAEVLRPGEITLYARKLFEILRELQGEDLHAALNDSNWINLTCDKTHFKIPGISAEEFPKIFEDEEVLFFKIKGDILLDMIHKTFFAMSTEENRINLNGALLETEKLDGHLMVKMVATDGHRLALSSVDTVLEDFLPQEKGVIIPRKGIMELRKILESDPGEVELAIKKGFCILRKGHVILKISLIDAEYPDYRRVISLEEGVTIELDREQLMRSLRRMGVMSSEKYSGVRIKIHENKIYLNSNNPDVGEASDEIDIPVESREFEVGYNVRYLIDAVEAISEKTVALELRDGLKPGTVRPGKGRGYLCVVMPLKM